MRSLRRIQIIPILERPLPPDEAFAGFFLFHQGFTKGSHQEKKHKYFKSQWTGNALQCLMCIVFAFSYEDNSSDNSFFTHPKVIVSQKSLCIATRSSIKLRVTQITHKTLANKRLNNMHKKFQEKQCLLEIYECCKCNAPSTCAHV